MIGAHEAAARAAGNAFEAMRGSWIDRLVGHAQICAALDDPWGAEAYAIEIDAAGQGDTVATWMDALGEASARAWPVRAAGLEVAGQLARVAIGVSRWASERRPAEAAEARAEVVASVARLLAHDTEIDLTRPRYRWRLPWTGPGLAAFHAQLAPVFAEVPAGAPRVPASAAALARIAAAGARWQAAIRSGAPPPADFHDRGEARAQIAAELAASRASVHAACDAMLARDAAWPEPLRVHHAAAMRAAVDAARSPVEVDLACAHAAACFEIEAGWLRALIATVAAPLRAALIASYEPSEAASASIAAARHHARALCGEPDPLRLPWIAELIAGALVPHATGPLGDLGSYAGEGGIELLGPWRTWTGITGGADPAALTATDLVADPARRRIALWDREVALDDADQLRRAPARERRDGRARTM